MQYTLNDLLIDTDTRTVWQSGRKILLPDLSFDVLVKLIHAAPEPVSVDEFSNSVWPAGLVSEETLAQRITLLRKALGDNPKTPRYIRTARGLGYAVTGPVSLASHEASSSFYNFFQKRFGLVTATAVIAILISAGLIYLPAQTSLNSSSTAAEAGPKSDTSLLLERAQQQLSLHQAKETNRAISMLRQALAAEPNRFDSRLTLSFALSTKATKFGGGISQKLEAETLARELIEEDPNNSNAWSALAYALSSQGKIDESLPAYERAYQLNPTNTPALSSAAHIQLLMGNFYQALSLENQAKKRGGSSRYAEIQIAQTLEFIGHEAAGNWRAKALSINPGQVVIISEIAKSYLRKGNLNAALEILTQAEGEDEQAPQILQLRSRIAIMQGDFTKAMQLLESTGAYGEFDATVLRAASGDVAQAGQLLRHKLANLKTLPNADDHIALAELAAALGHVEEASSLILQAVNLGWRDTNWLKYSPYLESLMASKAGQKIEKQISSEIHFQRRLIEKNPELTIFINS